MFVKKISLSSASGSKRTTSAPRYCLRYFEMPTAIREWMMARKVCESTTGQAALDEAAVPSPALLRREARVVGDDRVHADHELRPVVERLGGVQRLLERAVDEVVPVDLDGREEPRQRGARLDGLGDRESVVAGPAEAHALARVEVRGHEVELVPQLRGNRSSRPGCVKTACRYWWIVSLSKMPVGIARPIAAKDSSGAPAKRAGVR